MEEYFKNIPPEYITEEGKHPEYYETGRAKDKTFEKHNIGNCGSSFS